MRSNNPKHKSNRTKEQHNWYKYSSNVVCKPLHISFGGLCILNQLHNLCQFGVPTSAGDLNIKPAVAINGPTNNSVVNNFGLGDGLTRYQGLIHIGFTKENHSVCRHLFAGECDNNVSRLNKISRNDSLLEISHGHRIRFLGVFQVAFRLDIDSCSRRRERH